MICSMTGFGRAEYAEGGYKASVEIKSVNHKYLDVSVKLPRKLNPFEGKIRALLKEYATRGKTDIFIGFEASEKNNFTLVYNKELAAEYCEIYKKLTSDLGLSGNIDISLVAKSPDVITAKDASLDEASAWNVLEKAAKEAFSAFRRDREKEGEALKADISAKLGELKAYTAYISNKIPDIMSQYRARLEERVKELFEDFETEESRIAAEVTMHADKIAIDEELVRLDAHIKAAEDILSKGEAAGRELDFIAQEMNREANTILSKSTDIGIKDTGIKLKTCIEKIREQVQNIE